jgi:hypothetical protein
MSVRAGTRPVQSKGLRIRAMLESAANQRTNKPTTKDRPKFQKFQFHVNTELQKQLPITTQKSSYSSIVTNQSTEKKQPQLKAPPTTWQQHASPSTQTAVQSKQMNAATLESCTVGTNNSRLSLDQQTITKMMTQITQQFKDMERERIVGGEKQFKEMEREQIPREERQEMRRREREADAEEKREEREAKMEEKRLEAQREMFSFLKTMITMNTMNNNQEVPEAMNMSGPSAKRTSSQLSNSNEETVMTDTENLPILEVQENEEDVLSKRNKTRTGEEDDTEEDGIVYDDRALEKEQQDDPMETNETTNSTTGSFSKKINNQQFQSKTNNTPLTGVSQHYGHFKCCAIGQQ